MSLVFKLPNSQNVFSNIIYYSLYAILSILHSFLTSNVTVKEDVLFCCWVSKRTILNLWLPFEDYTEKKNNKLKMSQP